MSEKWDIYCVDCDKEHDAGETNHMHMEIVKAVLHSNAIAGLADFANDVNYFQLDIGRFAHLNPAWFAKHRGHKLVPRSEYGDIDGKCNKRVECSTCGSDYYHCILDADHKGEHQTKKF